MLRSIRLFAVLVVMLCCGAPATAHEIRPALLEITETRPGWFDITWKVPMRGDMILSISPSLPATLEMVAPPSEKLIPGALVQRFTCIGDSGSLVGQTISIDGLSSLQIDALVRITLADGTVHTAILRPDSPTFIVPERATRAAVAVSYARMGVTHILEGVDHLLFLVAMVLLVTGFWRVVKTITAFTVAHSITLVLATLGVVNVPSAPTEAIISLSIVFVAVEVVRKRRGQSGLAQRFPWGVALFFGLFHGLGFAGALSDIGVPAHEVPLALLMFNVGVEIGQIAFICVVLSLLELLRRLRLPSLVSPRLHRVCVLLPIYAIGGLAAFWTVQRVLSFLPAAM